MRDDEDTVIPLPVPVPEDWDKLEAGAVMAVAVEGGCAHQLDLEGRWLLVNNQVALLGMMDLDEDPWARHLPGVFALEFKSPEEREEYLCATFGRALYEFRCQQIRVGKEPVPGWTYPLELGNGYSLVTGLERDPGGNWTAVWLEFTSGCIPVPPDWELPRSRARLERERFLIALELSMFWF